MPTSILKRPCPPRRNRRRRALLFFFTLTLVVTGCKQASADKGEYAWVSAPEAALRDHVATIYNKTGVVHNGERVQILEKTPKKPFVRVRSVRGEEGWIQDRLLVSQESHDQMDKLSLDVQSAPAQISAVARATVNLHVTPGRKTDHLYLLKENEKVDLIERQLADKNGQPLNNSGSASDSGEKEDSPANKAPAPEDWWLVRDAQKHAGWVLGRMLYVDVPVDVAQYAEGQRIVAFLKLDEVPDGDQKYGEYLVLLTENKDGLPFDFNQVRVFSWNLKRHRYETAYRDHSVFGVLPAVLSTEDLGKEGTVPAFTIRSKDDSGATHEQKYTFRTPIVRRVVVPGEQRPSVPHARRRRRSRQATSQN
ncbi:MAG TPA: SH3 domain-containing protein [Candidatus Angelobacter sp.]|nr:SH3 domain-containing protein [Candidatus Angelobacter sp.]